VDEQVAREQVRSEIAHWRYAIVGLQELDVMASPRSWEQLEDYLRLRVRERLLGSVSRLAVEGAAVSALLDTGAPLRDVREQLLRLRQRYLEVESTITFYTEAIQQRTTPGLGAVLRGLDTIAVDALDLILRPLGILVPQVLVYPDQGRGASILRSGIPLWDRGGVSPVAAVKITRHNMGHPSALLHEIGHELQALTGWTAELASALAAKIAPSSSWLAELFGSWASEIASDVVAVHLAGWSPVPALANVVDGRSRAVHQIRTGDPHPPGFIRVLFNVELCRHWYGPGPWDDLARVWWSRHDPRALAGDDARIAVASVPVLPDIAAVCSRQPFPALGGRALHALADPQRVSPAALAELARTAGPTLMTSSYLSRHDSLRILALLTAEQPVDPAGMTAKVTRLHGWLAGLAPMPQPLAA
jgi:hypothetical protein